MLAVEELAHVPAGTAIAMSVSTNALPRAGIVVLWALQVLTDGQHRHDTDYTPVLGRAPRISYLYTSYPAAYALPLVGVFAFAESLLTSKGGLCSTFVVGVDSGMVMLWL